MTIVRRAKSKYLRRVNTPKSYTVDQARTKLERYCAYQERCHKEVVNKLREMRMIPIAIDEIVGHLIQHNYLNETRFAQAYARGKFRVKKWGRQRIVRELKQRDISAYNIKLALRQISETDYLTTFDAIAEKRWMSLKGEPSMQSKKKKCYDYLRYRGWEPHLIFDKLNELAKKN